MLIIELTKTLSLISEFANYNLYKESNKVYPPNIKLEAMARFNLVFLDLSSITPIKSISLNYMKTDKQTHCSTLEDNNPLITKAVSISQLYRSICINDDNINHKEFRIKLINPCC